MFHWIRLRAFVYATEERDRVLAAIKGLMDGELKISHAEGAYGDPIEIMEMKGKSDRYARAMVSALSENDRRHLLETIEDRTDDDSVFHFRLDKQALYLGNARLSKGGDVISVAMKIESYPSSRDRALESMRSYLEGLI